MRSSLSRNRQPIALDPPPRITFSPSLNRHPSQSCLARRRGLAQNQACHFRNRHSGGGRLHGRTRGKMCVYIYIYIYRSRHNYYRQSCYYSEFIYPKLPLPFFCLEIRMNYFNYITVTVLASAVTPSSPWTPNYHLESHLN